MSNKNGQKFQGVTVSLTDDEKERLQARATREMRSVRQMARLLIVSGLQAPSLAAPAKVSKKNQS